MRGLERASESFSELRTRDFSYATSKTYLQKRQRPRSISRYGSLSWSSCRYSGKFKSLAIRSAAQRFARAFVVYVQQLTSTIVCLFAAIQEEGHDQAVYILETIQVRFAQVPPSVAEHKQSGLINSTESEISLMSKRTEQSRKGRYPCPSPPLILFVIT